MKISKMSSVPFQFHEREILGLKTRSLTSLVENFAIIFHGRPDLLDCIPKSFRQEIFTRLVHKGLLEKALLSRIIDKNTSFMDLKSASGFDDAACSLLKQFANLSKLYLAEISATTEGLCNMFSSLHKLHTLELTKSPNFNDSVAKILAESCPCIKVLNVSRTGITDIGIAALGDNSWALLALDVSFTAVTFSGMEKLMTCPTGHTLKELKCRGSQIKSKEHILATILGFKRLEDYSFHFESSDDANWVLSRETTRLKNVAFNIPF